MTHQKNRKPGRIVRSIHFWLPALAFLGAVAGCGGATDQRFAPESYDEYTEPLTNAIVGSPSGVVTIGPADAGSPQGGGSTGSGGGMGTSTASGTSIGRGGGGTGGGTGTSTGTTTGPTFDGGPAEDGG